MRDLNHFRDARRRAQRFNLLTPVAVSDGADDGAFLAVNDVCLKTAFSDAIDNVVNLFRGGRAGHVDDHDSLPFSKTKRVMFSGLSWIDSRMIVAP